MMSFKGQQEIPKDEGDGADDDEWVSVCSFEKQDVVMPAGKDMKDKELKLNYSQSELLSVVMAI